MARHNNGLTNMARHTIYQGVHITYFNTAMARHKMVGQIWLDI